MSGETRALAEGLTRRRSTATAYSRTLAVVLIPFLAVAVVLLYLLPGETDTLFAWTIEPPLTAMLLASAYIGGIWFFAAGARRSGWSTISRGMPAVLLFASLLLLATLLHLDRFHAGHISFIAWIGLYLTTPFLVVAAMLLHRRSGDASRAVSEYAIPLSVRVVLACLGVGSLIAGASLFVGIDTVVSAWPWALTPLTAQVTGAVLSLPGAVNLALLLDGRWSAFRTIFQAQIVSLVAIVGALLVRHDDIRQPGPGIVFSVGIALSLAAYLAFYAYCEHRRGTAGEASD